MFPHYKVKYALLRIAVPYFWIRSCISGKIVESKRYQDVNRKDNIKSKYNHYVQNPCRVNTRKRVKDILTEDFFKSTKRKQLYFY